MAIEVSRRDVTSEQILDLQSETRFLKLPVDPYLELLGVEPLASVSYTHLTLPTILLV